MKTQKQVLRKKISIGLKIAKLHDELIKLQNECPHHSLRYRANGSTGSYDRDDAFWYDWFCPNCDKRWTTEQSYAVKTEILSKHPNAKQIDKYKNYDEYHNFYRYDK
jgi:hypothetical protein